jgi:hypothetical protein
MFAGAAFVDISYINQEGYTSRAAARDILCQRAKASFLSHLRAADDNEIIGTAGVALRRRPASNSPSNTPSGPLARYPEHRERREPLDRYLPLARYINWSPPEPKRKLINPPPAPGLETDVVESVQPRPSDIRRSSDDDDDRGRASCERGTGSGHD